MSHLHDHGCRRAAGLITRRCDAALPLHQHLWLRWHLLLCAACRRFERQTALLQAAMRRWRDEI